MPVCIVIAEDPKFREILMNFLAEFKIPAREERRCFDDHGGSGNICHVIEVLPGEEYSPDNIAKVMAFCDLIRSCQR